MRGLPQEQLSLPLEETLEMAMAILHHLDRGGRLARVNCPATISRTVRATVATSTVTLMRLTQTPRAGNVAVTTPRLRT